MSDSEFSELSSDDDDDDNEWSSVNNTINGSMQRESSDSDDGFDSSDDKPLATLANKADVEDKSGYKFNKRRAFLPPSDLEFIDAPVEPEPKHDNPITTSKAL